MILSYLLGSSTMLIMFGDEWVIHNTALHDTGKREERQEETPEPESSPFTAHPRRPHVQFAYL